MPFRRKTDADSADPAALEAPAAEEPSEFEERADELAELTTLDAPERDTVARHVREALADFQLARAAGHEPTPTTEGDAITAAVPRIAEEIGAPPATVAHEIAHAQALQARWRKFLDEHGISEREPVDRRIAAREALDAISRKRDRLEERLERETLPHKVETLRAALDHLDAEESRHWELLHPPAFTDQFLGERLYFCRYCDHEITRERHYRLGVCPPCEAAHTAVYDEPFPTI